MPNRSLTLLTLLAAGFLRGLAQGVCRCIMTSFSPPATTAGAPASKLIITRDLVGGTEGFTSDETYGFTWQGPASPNSMIPLPATLVSNICVDLSIPASLVAKEARRR